MIESIDLEEKEMLRLSCFEQSYISEIPHGWTGLYLANPKKRHKRFDKNDEFAKWLFLSHGLTFTKFQTVRHGEFYIFKIDESMKLWAERKMKELTQTNPGVHFKESLQLSYWGDGAMTIEGGF